MFTYLDSIKGFLRERPGYLKYGPDKLSVRLNAPKDLCEAALKQVREELKTSSPLDTFLDNNNINKNSVDSVKYWQTQSGDLRYSIVSKNTALNRYAEAKEILEEFVASYSPKVPKKDYDKLNNPVALEISLPDLHYGKLADMSTKELEDLYLEKIFDLVQKAEGLQIERFILPVGNDGLNSEGLRQTTTKGTPQHDNASWKQTFRGYWILLVSTIDYLSRIAPVDVVIISGNHDYERMFYVGDVLAAWFKFNENVEIDNGYEHRKYLEYGVNMLMFTHGDTEKMSDLPLIMATEQPEMFARTYHHEVHCGHLHKEMVNEYRGIKVRFLPSICPNDEWHKRMGYEASRTAQAYIWSKNRGLEGYLQSNVKYKF
jgi:hypothetical protein